MTAKQRLKSIIKTTAIGVNMSKESEEKSLPGYKSLATSQRELNLQNQNMMLQNKIIIDLLTSLNRYHGKPESKKGWLEDIVCYKEEQKQGDIKFRKKTNVSSILSLSIALTALTISITGVEYFILILRGFL